MAKRPRDSELFGIPNNYFEAKQGGRGGFRRPKEGVGGEFRPEKGD